MVIRPLAWEDRPIRGRGLPCVICPAHMWEFDLRTGLPPGVSEGASLTRYPVELRGQDVLVDPEAPLT